jgi:hypothetical protein
MQHKQTGWWISPLTTTTALGLVQSLTGALTVGQWIQEASPPGFVYLLTRASFVFVYGVYAVLIFMVLWDRRTRWRGLALLSAAGVFAGLMFATSLVGVPNMIDRTLLPAWAPILVLLGIAAAPVGGQGWLRWVRAGSVVGMVSLWAVGWAWLAQYSAYDRRPSHAGCFQWLEDRVEADDMIVFTPGWLADTAAWYLRDVVTGEQFFTAGAPAYAGKPPRHTLTHHRVMITGQRVEEGAWSERIRQALRERRGKDFSVWLVSGYWQVIMEGPALDQLESFFRGRFKRGARYTPPHLTQLVAQQWVPRADWNRGGYPTRAPAAVPSSTPIEQEREGQGASR